MRYLFDYIFKKVRLRYIPLVIIGLIGLQFLFAFMTSIMNLSKNEFPLEKSPNPEASKYFLNAIEYRNYIAMLHKFVDYDNFLMTPLLKSIQEEYEKGVKLLPKDSAEDVLGHIK